MPVRTLQHDVAMHLLAGGFCEAHVQAAFTEGSVHVAVRTGSRAVADRFRERLMAFAKRHRLFRQSSLGYFPVGPGHRHWVAEVLLEGYDQETDVWYYEELVVRLLRRGGAHVTRYV